MNVEVSAQAASTAPVSQVCSRHGEPAAQHRRVKLISRTPQWAYVLLVLGLVVFGLVPFIIVTLALRKTVNAPAWPFCTHCHALRKRRLLIGSGLFVGGLVLLAVGLALPRSIGAIGGLAFIILILAAATAVSYSTWRAISGAWVSRDGLWVEVPTAHQRFAEQVAALPATPAQPAHRIST
jgi:hypothetical protein